jgi:hypothetical protein
MFPQPLWGRNGDLDFWTALARREVARPEYNAVRLLERTCDPWRFEYYCRHGEIPCLGNLTRKLYLVRKEGGASELDNEGREVASWCISIGPHAKVPDTDHVFALKCHIEGEEHVFMAIGNRTRKLNGRLSQVCNFINIVPPEWNKGEDALKKLELDSLLDWRGMRDSGNLAREYEFERRAGRNPVRRHPPGFAGDNPLVWQGIENAVHRQIMEANATDTACTTGGNFSFTNVGVGGLCQNPIPFEPIPPPRRNTRHMHYVV